jgi:hypothetical protein
MVDIEFDKNVALARALGDPSPADDTGEVIDFPYSPPGSTPKPGAPPPGPVNEEIDRAHFYAAFVDPAAGVRRTPRPKVRATPSSLGFVLPNALQPHRYRR